MNGSNVFDVTYYQNLMNEFKKLMDNYDDYTSDEVYEILKKLFIQIEQLLKIIVSFSKNPSSMQKQLTALATEGSDALAEIASDIVEKQIKKNTKSIISWIFGWFK